MARVLIVGQGSSASALTGALGRERHVVRTVAVADRGALEHVAIVCWLNDASPERFLLRAVDSTMRGFVYQARGWERLVLEAARRNSIPVAALRTDPARVEEWLAHACAVVGSLLGGAGAGAGVGAGVGMGAGAGMGAGVGAGMGSGAGAGMGSGSGAVAGPGSDAVARYAGE